MKKENRRMTLCQMKNPDNPYEKGLRQGVASLSNQELLALLIRSGTRQRNAIELAGDLLQLHGEGLRNLCVLSLDELKQIPGIGKIKALQLKAVSELAKRISEQERREKILLKDPKSISNYFMEEMTYLSTEQVRICYFDHRLNMTGQEILSIGTNCKAFADVSEVLRHVFRANADGFVLLHNHPTGDPEPSYDDLMVTKMIKTASDLVGLHFHDHIVIGDHTYYSFNEHGELSSREEI